MASPDKDIHDTAPAEVQKLLGQDKLNKMGSHEERQGSSDEEGTLRRNNTSNTVETAKDINKRVQPDDSEQYAHEDNAEARDSRKPYEDVITPESYDDDIKQGTQGTPKT